MDYSQLRHQLRKKRQTLNLRQQQQHSQSILYQCQKQAIFKCAYRIGVYLPFDGEINTHAIITFLKQNNKQVFVPKINNNKLFFVPHSSTGKKNRFGIIEPDYSARFYPKKMNLILMPLVGFDSSANRLGMGGGFYDRSLSFVKKQQKFNYPKLIGIAHSCQQVNKLKPQRWDIKPKFILTEKTNIRHLHSNKK